MHQYLLPCLILLAHIEEDKGGALLLLISFVNAFLPLLIPKQLGFGYLFL